MSIMTVQPYADGQAFWHEVAHPLCALPVPNNVFIGLAHRIRKETRKDYFRAGVFDGPDLLLGAMRTPPHRLNLAHNGQGEAGVDALVEHMVKMQIEVPGVVAEQALAERFGARWSAVTGQAAKSSRHGGLQNLYEIESVVQPSDVEGAMRPARASERELLLKWEMAFAVDAGLPAVERERDYITRFVDEGLSDQTFYVWELRGAPVSTARLRPVAALGARVSGVYTPNERRGHGFAAALTAALSTKLLMEGFWCCLFADADNPVSNRVYQRIGYVKLATFADITFGVS